MQRRVGERDPFNHFVGELMLLERVLGELSPERFMGRLKNIFCDFLEVIFFVPVKGEPLKGVMRGFRQYHPLIYKEYRQQLLDFFADLNGEVRALGRRDYEQLLSKGRELGIQLFLKVRGE